MTIPLLTDVVIMLTGGLVASLAVKKTNIPKIVSYIVAGVIIGPSALNLISNIDEIKLIAEIGVILLLFVIGLEFSIERLLSSKKIIFFSGSLQILLTIAIVFVGSIWLKVEWNAAILLGFLFAISSTAILLKILEAKHQLNTDFGKRIVGVLVFQDLAVIPMVLLIPLLAKEQNSLSDILINLFGTVIFLGLGVYVFRLFARFVFPIIVRNSDKELLMIGVTLICFSLPLFVGFLNISLALGAFLAGLIISETNYKNKILHSIEELTHVFSCIFFISIGLLLNLSYVWNNLSLIIICVVSVLIINLIASTIALRSVHSWSQSFISAMCLVQIGEFAFVLSKIGYDKKILTLEQYDIFLAVAIITMIITPFLLDLGSYFEKYLHKKSEL